MSVSVPVSTYASINFFMHLTLMLANCLLIIISELLNHLSNNIGLNIKYVSSITIIFSFNLIWYLFHRCARLYFLIFNYIVFKIFLILSLILFLILFSFFFPSSPLAFLFLSPLSLLPPSLSFPSLPPFPPPLPSVLPSPLPSLSPLPLNSHLH